MDWRGFLDVVAFTLIISTPAIYAFSTVIYPYDYEDNWREQAERDIEEYVNKNEPVTSYRVMSDAVNLTYLQSVYVTYQLGQERRVYKCGDALYSYYCVNGGAIQRTAPQ